MDVLPFLTLYDLHGLGYVLLELVLASLCSAPVPAPTTATPPPPAAPPAAGTSPGLSAPALAAAAAAGSVGGGGGDIPAGPRAPPELQGLKRLVEDVFADDVMGGFRDYCKEEPSWAPAVEFLDEGERGGW
jgi:hypothetical protein